MWNKSETFTSLLILALVLTTSYTTNSNPESDTQSANHLSIILGGVGTWFCMTTIWLWTFINRLFINSQTKLTKTINWLGGISLALNLVVSLAIVCGRIQTSEGILFFPTYYITLSIMFITMITIWCRGTVKDIRYLPTMHLSKGRFKYLRPGDKIWLWPGINTWSIRQGPYGSEAILD